MQRIVIVGGGIAALSAAEAAREQDAQAKITILSADAHLPYARPMLTKLPLGRFHPVPVQKQAWFDARNIEICLSTAATAIDRAHKMIATSNCNIPYDRCILAMGAESRIPPIAGRNLPGVFVLRNAQDAAKIFRYAMQVQNAVILGGGVIGLEAAYQLSAFGIHVTVMESAAYLMHRLLEEGTAKILQRSITRFSIMTEVQVQKICGVQRVEAVQTQTGTLPADMVLLCCGNRPNANLAAELAGAHGFIVNAQMQTDDPNVYACGDCTTLGGLWQQAAEQGRVAGTNCAGGSCTYSDTDTGLRMQGPEFGLYCKGNLKTGQWEEKTVTRRPLLEIQERPRTAIIRNFYENGTKTGTFVLGDLSQVEEAL